MKVKLKSDFRDFYDHAFDLKADRVFTRLAKTTVRKDIDLQYAQHQGIPTIVPIPISSSRLISYPIVLHTDITSHRGESKQLVFNAIDVMSIINKTRCQEAFYTPFVGSPGKSYRTLWIGNRYRCQLFYESFDDWRSNVGNVEITILDFEEGDWSDDIRKHFSECPLLAFDFVEDSRGVRHLIDINAAPGLSGTGIEDMIYPGSIYEAIRDHPIASDRF